MQLANAGRPLQLPLPVVAVAVAPVVAVAVARGGVVGVGAVAAPQGEADWPEPAIVLPSTIKAPHTLQLVPAAGSSPHRPPFVFL